MALKHYKPTTAGTRGLTLIDHSELHKGAPEKSLTVLEAISSVGGFTDIANTSKVRVLRTQNGKQESLDVDVAQITKQGNKLLDIALMPGDVVFVPQSMF